LDQNIEETNLTLQAFLNFRAYLKTSYKYWLMVGLTLASVIAVYVTQEIALQSFLRYSVGLLLVLVLPGYSLVKALFPAETLSIGKQSGLNRLLTMAFSIVFSIVVVSIVGLILDFTPWGVGVNSLTLSLSSLTVFFATIAMLRDYQATLKSFH
jgi:uncharacterized membrane protein